MANDDGSDIVALARKAGLLGFGGTPERVASRPPEPAANADDGSDIVAIARKVGLLGFGRLAERSESDSTSSK